MRADFGSPESKVLGAEERGMDRKQKSAGADETRAVFDFFHPWSFAFCLFLFTVTFKDWVIRVLNWLLVEVKTML